MWPEKYIFKLLKYSRSLRIIKTTIVFSVLQWSRQLRPKTSLMPEQTLWGWAWAAAPSASHRKVRDKQMHSALLTLWSNKTASNVLKVQWEKLGIIQSLDRTAVTVICGHYCVGIMCWWSGKPWQLQRAMGNWNWTLKHVNRSFFLFGSLNFIIPVIPAHMLENFNPTLLRPWVNFGISPEPLSTLTESYVMSY